MKFGKGYGFLMMVLIAGCLLCGCEKRKSESENRIAGNTKETKDINKDARVQWEKGYDLPLEATEQKEAATECKEMMKKIQDIYQSADKGTASNDVLQDETMLEMQKAMMETGSPVSATVPYSDMENYEKTERFPSEKYQEGIPKEEFESLIMEYLPVSVENLQQYAEFDEKTKRYTWAPLGCGNYAPNFFGTSVPEVVEVRENPDSTVTLTVNAVCDMVICDDALITHDLTVKFKEDGSFQYLGNEIRKEDRNNIPEYQYRVKGEIKNGS